MEIEKLVLTFERSHRDRKFSFRIIIAGKRTALCTVKINVLKYKKMFHIDIV